MKHQPPAQPRHALDWTPPRRTSLWRRSAVAAVSSAVVAIGGVTATVPASAAQPSVFQNTVDSWSEPIAEAEAAEQAAEERAVQLAVEVMADAEQARAERSAAEQAAAEQAAAEEAAAEEAAAAEAAAEAAAALRSLPLATGTYAVGSVFGETGSWASYHTGLDFVAGEGTPVYSVVSGTVVSTTAGSWAGIHVAIQADDGSSTLYAHLSGKDVQVGDTVDAGELIGYVGNTGRSFGAHLHFEYYPAGILPGDIYNAADPMAYLEGLGLNV